MIKHVNQHQVSCWLWFLLLKLLIVTFFLSFATEERVFSLRFAAVPPHSSPPKGEHDLNLKRSGTHVSVVVSVDPLCVFFSPLGCVVRQRWLWMPSSGIRQSLVSHPATLSSAPRLCSGNDRPPPAHMLPFHKVNLILASVGIFLFY